MNHNNSPDPNKDISAEFAEKLEALRSLVWDIVTSGRGFNELAVLLDKQNFELDAVVQCSDGENGGEYWRLSVMQFRYYNDPTCADYTDFIELERLMPTLDGKYIPSLFSYAFDTITTTLQKELINKDQPPDYSDEVDIGVINDLMQRLGAAKALTDKQSKKILKIHNSLIQKDFPEHAND